MLISEELIKKNVNQEKKEALVIIKQFGDKKNAFNDALNASKIINFINLYIYPKVIEFSQITSSIIFSKRNREIILFSSKFENIYKEYIKLLNEIWLKVKGEIRLFICDVNTLY